VQLDIPMRLRRTVDLSLNRRLPSTPESRQETVYTSLPWSLIVNSRWSHNKRQSPLSTATTDDVFFTDSALSIPAKTGAWTGEHSGYKLFPNLPTTGQNAGWVSQATRVLRDWPEQQIRLNFGDLSTSAAYGMTPRELTGFSINRQWSLNPRSTVQALPTHSLSLPAGASIDVEVNGLTTSSVRLGPGNYKISDIPLFSGANDVVLRIVEPGGKVRFYDLKYFFDAALLKPGLTDWNLAIGQPHTPNTASDLPLNATGMLTRGIFETLTAGMGFQLQTRSTRPANLWQIHSIWASPWGTWTQSISRSEQTWGSALAGILQWGWLPPAGSSNSQILAGSVQWTQTQKGYAPLDSQSPPPARQEIGARVYFKLPEEWSGSWSWRYNRMENQNRQVMGWITSKKLSQTWALEMSLQQQKSPAEVALNAQIPSRSYNFYIGLRYRAPTPPNATMQWQTQTQVTQTSGQDSRWQQNWTGQGSTDWSGGDAKWQTQAQQTRQNSETQTLLQGELQTGRFRLDTRYSQATQAGTTPDTPQLVSANWESTFSSALILSPHGLHISAPITDSAALFIPRNGYETLNLYVDPQKLTSAASTDYLGMPVLASIMSYSPRQLQLDLDPLPPGRQIGNAVPWVNAGYRSVVAVPIGSDANTQIKGSVKTKDGQALGLIAIRVQRLATDGGDNTIELFTNRKGQFTSPALRPGNYTMVIPGENTILNRWYISPEESGIKDIGTVQWQPITTAP
jgi:outer membrane usher protein